MDSFQDAKEEVKRAVDIVDLIGQFVQLRRAGQSFVGLCPFHSEKAPSFTVSPARQMFHCFGCKKGGDVFAFWMEYHKVSFPEALRDLAEKYNVALPEKSRTARGKENADLKEAIFKLNEKAADYYHRVLLESGGAKPGRDYLLQRGISKEIIMEYKLGYAPNAWSALTNHIKKKPGTIENAVQAGLIVPRKTEGHYDRFRNRIMFPITNLRDQIAGFGGRVLDDSLPKYLNTPETPVFRKGEMLYGLHAALPSLRKGERAVIVEGYTDVLSLRRHGFQEAVATLGTALTREHIRLLKGHVALAVVVFDADQAGKAAAMKSLPFFLDEGLPAKVTVLPEGEDPDTFVQKQGLPAFMDLLNGAVPIFDFCMEMKIGSLTDEPEARVRVLREFVPLLADLRDHTLQSLYARRLSERLHIDESLLQAELHHWRRKRAWEEDNVPLKERLSGSKATVGDDPLLLNMLTHHPHIMDRVLKPEFRLLLSDPLVAKTFEAISDVHLEEGDLGLESILEKLEEGPIRECLREAMLQPPMCRDEELDVALQDFENKVRRIKARQSLNRARQRGDLQSVNEIIRSMDRVE